MEKFYQNYNDEIVGIDYGPEVVLRRTASVGDEVNDDDDDDQKPVELRSALFEAMNIHPIPHSRIISPAQLRRFYSQKRTTKFRQGIQVVDLHEHVFHIL